MKSANDRNSSSDSSVLISGSMRSATHVTTTTLFTIQVPYHKPYKFACLCVDTAPLEALQCQFTFYIGNCRPYFTCIIYLQPPNVVGATNGFQYLVKCSINICRHL